MSKVLPTRVCPKCGDDFTPIPRPGYRGGTLPEACPGCIRAFNWDKHRDAHLAGLKAASAAKKVKARQRVEAQLRQQFGAISERDAAIYAFGVAVGYARGYDAAYNLRHGKQRA